MSKVIFVNVFQSFKLYLLCCCALRRRQHYDTKRQICITRKYEKGHSPSALEPLAFLCHAEASESLLLWGNCSSSLCVCFQCLLRPGPATEASPGPRRQPEPADEALRAALSPQPGSNPHSPEWFWKHQADQDSQIQGDPGSGKENPDSSFQTCDVGLQSPTARTENTLMRAAERCHR